MNDAISPRDWQRAGEFPAGNPPHADDAAYQEAGLYLPIRLIRGSPPRFAQKRFNISVFAVRQNVD